MWIYNPDKCDVIVFCDLLLKVMVKSDRFLTFFAKIGIFVGYCLKKSVLCTKIHQKSKSILLKIGIKSEKILIKILYISYV